MEIRKVFTIGKSLVVTIPEPIAKVLQIRKGDYVEIHLADKETLVLRKHNIEGERKRNNG